MLWYTVFNSPLKHFIYTLKYKNTHEPFAMLIYASNEEINTVQVALPSKCQGAMCEAVYLIPPCMPRRAGVGVQHGEGPSS